MASDSDAMSIYISRGVSVVAPFAGAILMLAGFALAFKNRVVGVRCDLCREWHAEEGKEVSGCVEACPFGALRMVPVEECRLLIEGGAISHTDLESAEDAPGLEAAPDERQTRSV